MNLRNFWSCIKKSYRKLSFFEFLTIVFFAFIISGIIVGDVLAGDALTVKYQVPIVGGENPQTLPLYINMVYKWLMGAGLVLVGIMVTIGGFMYVSSGGDPKTVGTGKKYIINALIGMLLLASSYLILNTINPDATEMDDIVVKPVTGVVLKSAVQVPWGCECYANTDCFNSVTSAYFCDWSGGGKLVYDAYVKSPITAKLDENVQGIIVAVGVTALVFGTAGLGAIPVLTKVGTTLVRGAVTVAKFGTKVAWGTLKFTAKWLLPPAVSLVVANPALAVMGAFYFIGGGAAFDFELSTFEKTCNKPSGEVKGICLPNVFRYARLRPHGWGDTDIVNSGKNLYESGIFSIYNTDGTIPQRKSYFGDRQPFTIIADNSQQLVDISHNFKDFVTDGIANTDGCQSYIDKYAENYCPCLEWFGDNSIFLQCKRQAKCATLQATGTYAGGADNKQICLTGTKGELCIDDTDCVPGLKCVDLGEIGKAAYGDDWRVFADANSLFRKYLGSNSSDGTLNLKFLSTGKESPKKGDVINPKFAKVLSRDRVCMPDGETDVKKISEDIKGFLYQPSTKGCKEGLIDNSFVSSINLNTCYKVNYLNEKLPICGGDFNEKNFTDGKIAKISLDNYNKLMDKVGHGMSGESPGMNILRNATSGWSNRVYWWRATKLFVERYYDGIRSWGDSPSYPSDLDDCTQKAFLSYNVNQINKFKDNFEYYQKIGNDYYFIIYYDSNEPDGYRNFSEYCGQKSPGCSCDVKISMMLLSCGVGDFVVNSSRDFAYGLCSTPGAYFDYPYILLEVLPNYVYDIQGVVY